MSEDLREKFQQLMPTPHGPSDSNVNLPSKLPPTPRPTARETQATASLWCTSTVLVGVIFAICVIVAISHYTQNKPKKNERMLENAIDNLLDESDDDPDTSAGAHDHDISTWDASPSASAAGKTDEFFQPLSVA